jgi:hypothetical protein
MLPAKLQYATLLRPLLLADCLLRTAYAVLPVGASSCCFCCCGSNGSCPAAVGTAVTLCGTEGT